MVTLPYEAIWSDGGQASLRSSDDIIARNEQSGDEFWVWGHFRMSHELSVEVAVSSIAEVEQVRLAVLRAKKVDYVWAVQSMQIAAAV